MIAAVYSLVSYLCFKGHPLLLVTAGVTLALFVLLFYWHRAGSLWKATYLCVPYLLLHTISAVCCYRDWLTPAMKIPNKDIYEFQILLNFIVINALPLVDIRLTAFGMVPILLIGTYLQVTV